MRHFLRWRLSAPFDAVRYLLPCLSALFGAVRRFSVLFGALQPQAESAEQHRSAPTGAERRRRAQKTA
eukprot:625145-Alexandrium_andersonii.AAC.1